MPLNHPDLDQGGQVDGNNILDALENTFRDHPGLTEFGLLFADGPLSEEAAWQAIGCGSGQIEPQVAAGAVVVVEQRLALAYWCLPALLTAAKMGVARVQKISEWWAEEEHAAAMLKFTRALLLISADTASAWNHRKRLIHAGLWCRKAELRFLDLVQSKHQKCQEAWAHRRWVVIPLLDAQGGVAGLPEIVDKELAAIDRAVTMYHKNYNAWSYKRWMCERIPADRLGAIAEDARVFAKMHVSDSAAQHFRVALLDLRLCGDERAHGNAAKDGEDRGALPSPLLEEMAFSRDLIQRFPGHDALWGALRSLMRSWVRFGSRGEGGDSSQSSGSPVGEVGEGGTSLAEELCAWGEALGSGVQGESTNSGLRESAGSVEAGRGQQRESSEEGRVASILRFARSRFQDRLAANRDAERSNAVRFAAWLLHRYTAPHRDVMWRALPQGELREAALGALDCMLEDLRQRCPQKDGAWSKLAQRH